ncbi:MAG: Peptide-methionine (R)-S-oxide reductase MsrB, partial [uncultured Acidimicrobiales bacterium]
HRQVRRSEGRRHLPLCRVLRRALPVRDQVRLAFGLAQLHRAGRPRQRRPARRPQLRHGAHRGDLQALRRPPRPRVPRRAQADRPPVLHQLAVPRVRPGGV